ncbi:MAG: hypothetical protein V4719_12155 [Planctomycetota bacterium]
MAFWWKKKPQSVPFQKWDLPGEVGTISLPSYLIVEIENNAPLIAYQDESLTLRFSSISFTKPGQTSEEMAKKTGHFSPWGRTQVRQIKNLKRPHSNWLLSQLNATAVGELIEYWRRRP